MAHNRKDKEYIITKELKIGRDEEGFNYYMIVKGERIELNEIEMQITGGIIDKLLYHD